MKKRQRQNGKKKFLFLMRKIYKLLESGEINIAVCRMRETAGLHDPKDSFIYLNPTEDMLPSLIHECLHSLISRGELRRKMTTIIEEEEVKYLEWLCVKFLNHHHAIKLLKLLMANLAPRTKTGDKKYD